MARSPDRLGRRTKRTAIKQLIAPHIPRQNHASELTVIPLVCALRIYIILLNQARFRFARNSGQQKQAVPYRARIGSDDGPSQLGQSSGWDRALARSRSQTFRPNGVDVIINARLSRQNPTVQQNARYIYRQTRTRRSRNPQRVSTST